MPPVLGALMRRIHSPHAFFAWCVKRVECFTGSMPPLLGASMRRVLSLHAFFAWCVKRVECFTDSISPLLGAQKHCVHRPCPHT
eukprot:1145043-Pelagomonas_calceolata.AAC.4